MSTISTIHNEYYDPDRYFTDHAVTIIREEKRRARILHICHCCGTPIQPGELYDYFFVRDDEALIKNTTFSSHQHRICPVPQDLVCPITGDLR